MVRFKRPALDAVYTCHYDSPFGRYILGSSSKGVVCIKTANQEAASIKGWEKSGYIIKKDKAANAVLVQELDAYFSGALKRFTVPLDLRGTDFQVRVWKKLQAIPYGETRSYGEIASQVGRPKGARAVGRANGSNPVSIVVPCHRVIGANGSLVGYGGGLDRKTALLELETQFA